MKAEFEIIGRRVESYTGKRGRVEQDTLLLLDRDQNPMTSLVDYILSEDERSKYTGELRGKTLQLAVEDVRVGFGNRIRFGGRVLALK